MEWQQTFLLNLRTTCDKLHIYPNLQMILLTALEAWFTKTPPHLTTNADWLASVIQWPSEHGLVATSG
jgi:hypothetical protein